MNSALSSDSFREHLTGNLIPFWNKMTDTERGGFFGYADECGIPDKNSPKGCILNSRILWFYSASYNLLKDPELLDQATFAKGYDEEFSKACTAYEAVHTLPANIIARMKNEFGVEIVK